jgi:hypothetical protein
MRSVRVMRARHDGLATAAQPPCHAHRARSLVPWDRGATMMHAADDRDSDGDGLTATVDRRVWLIIACVASGVSIALTLTLAMLLTRR